MRRYVMAQSMTVHNFHAKIREIYGKPLQSQEKTRTLAISIFNGKSKNITAKTKIRQFIFSFFRNCVLIKKSYFAGGTVYFFCKSIRSRSPTCRYTSTRVVRAASRTGAVGSETRVTIPGRSFEIRMLPDPCLEEIKIGLMSRRVSRDVVDCFFSLFPLV